MELKKDKDSSQTRAPFKSVSVDEESLDCENSSASCVSLIILFMFYTN